MNALTKYDAARYALQAASSVDEVKDIRDKAEAMAAYARQAKDTELVEWATEIKVRAERRAGQMLAEMPKAKGGEHYKTTGNTIVPVVNKTLADIGISKNESARWQKLAAVSEDQFEHAVAAAKDVAGEVTTAAMLRIEKANREHNAKQKTPAPAPATQQPAPIQPEDDPDNYGPSEEEIRNAEKEAAEEIESLRRVCESDDAIKAAIDEAKRYRELARVFESRNNGLMGELAATKRRISSLERQVAKLEKEIAAHGKAEF